MLETLDFMHSKKSARVSAHRSRSLASRGGPRGAKQTDRCSKRSVQHRRDITPNYKLQNSARKVRWRKTRGAEPQRCSSPRLRAVHPFTIPAGLGRDLRRVKGSPAPSVVRRRERCVFGRNIAAAGR